MKMKMAAVDTENQLLNREYGRLCHLVRGPNMAAAQAAVTRGCCRESADPAALTLPAGDWDLARRVRTVSRVVVQVA